MQADQYKSTGVLAINGAMRIATFAWNSFAFFIEQKPQCVIAGISTRYCLACALPVRTV